MESPVGSGLAPSMGPLAKLANVLFTPSKVFEAVAARPGWDWLVPVVLMLVVAFVVGGVTSPRIDVDQAVRLQMAQIEKGNPGMAEDQKDVLEERIRGQFTWFMSPVGRLVMTVVMLVPIFLVPLIYHGVASAFGKAGRYVGVLAGYAFAQVPTILYWILNGVVALPRDKIDVEDVQAYRLVKSNVGAFLDPSTNKAVQAFAANLDIFAIWAVALSAIMLAKTTKLSPKGAAILAFSLWGVWVLIQAGLGAIQGAFAG